MTQPKTSTKTRRSVQRHSPFSANARILFSNHRRQSETQFPSLLQDAYQNAGIATRLQILRRLRHVASSDGH